MRHIRSQTSPTYEASHIKETAHNRLAQSIVYRNLLILLDMERHVTHVVRTAGGFRWDDHLGWMESKYDIT